MFFVFLFHLLFLFSVPLDAAEEPDIVAVQDAALAYAHLAPDEIGSWKKRILLSALLPRLQLEYGHNRLNDIHVDVEDSIYVGSAGVTVGPDESTYAQKAAARENYGIRAIWNLQELLFSRDQLQISAETRKLAEERYGLLKEVNTHFYKRQKFLMELNDAQISKEIKKISFLQLQIEESIAHIDAFTGGWYRRQLEKP
ncbi:MAG: hypothetical protein A3I05_10055 [Deltaproteobacteria bacterium RIFCSPLOWO2_02_FULL_44_10]|nr:MAG: hypothetical protein A3C46_08925 [Deltaproteobacteria bacterium RIFCSPHIGHO2_02_FULL_44_16]OGQ45891.1 MAG: hypothetical protein A3I05_10055 [Deltaproteobacteria bacterium RIFCSPLOWO2_02_FULL_44_10]